MIASERAGPPKIIAEISCNHKQSIEHACELINAAKWAGADLVKIQAYKPDDMTVHNNYMIDVGSGTPWDGKFLKDLYGEAYTPNWMLEPMFREANRAGIPLFSSVFSTRGLELLENLGCPIYKIASFENNDYELIRQVSKTGKPLIVSLGVMSPGTIGAILDVVEDKHKVTFMHCISAYPTHPNEADIGKMVSISYQAGSRVGFSDHTLTNHAAMAATVLGAPYIEKHITITQDTADKAHSIDRFRFSEYVHDIKTIYSTIHAKYNPEGPYQQFKRSLYAVEAIPEGTQLTKDNVKAMRPYVGVDPIMLDDVVGKTAARAIRYGEPIKLEDVV